MCRGAGAASPQVFVATRDNMNAMIANAYAAVVAGPEGAWNSRWFHPDLTW